jgi:hypothetical protein
MKRDKQLICDLLHSAIARAEFTPVISRIDNSEKNLFHFYLLESAGFIKKIDIPNIDKGCIAWQITWKGYDFWEQHSKQSH